MKRDDLEMAKKKTKNPFEKEFVMPPTAVPTTAPTQTFVAVLTYFSDEQEWLSIGELFLSSNNHLFAEATDEWNRSAELQVVIDSVNQLLLSFSKGVHAMTSGGDLIQIDPQHISAGKFSDDELDALQTSIAAHTSRRVILKFPKFEN